VKVRDRGTSTFGWEVCTLALHVHGCSSHSICRAVEGALACLLRYAIYYRWVRFRVSLAILNHPLVLLGSERC
jgi:hypothetical protein